eukprot:TRINITY_DN1797_c0_g1_i3.p2 TRINITY_DN1797_c0_g1~~TRINITY_DN1797_c0_g1_i3.p2  ORF type:complete len:156 (+),score=16.00 TRINITY_DN1797_c0_g1_i3:60-527(+)
MAYYFYPIVYMVGFSLVGYGVLAAKRSLERRTSLSTPPTLVALTLTLALAPTLTRMSLRSLTLLCSLSRPPFSCRCRSHPAVVALLIPSHPPSHPTRRPFHSPFSHFLNPYSFHCCLCLSLLRCFFARCISSHPLLTTDSYLANRRNGSFSPRGV